MNSRQDGYDSAEGSCSEFRMLNSEFFLNKLDHRYARVSMVWKKVFHTMENVGRIFPHCGKRA